MSPNDREFDLLPNCAVESFWDALWLELWPFLCSMEEPRRMNAWGDPCACHVSDAPPLCYGVQLWGHLFGSNRPPPTPGVLYLLGLDSGICGLFFIKFYSILLGVAILG